MIKYRLISSIEHSAFLYLHKLSKFSEKNMWGAGTLVMNFFYDFLIAI